MYNFFLFKKISINITRDLKLNLFLLLLLSFGILIFLFMILYRQARSYGCGSGGFDDFSAAAFLTKGYTGESSVRCFAHPICSLSDTNILFNN